MNEPILIENWAYSTPNEDGYIEVIFKIKDVEYKLLVTRRDARTMNHWLDLYKIEKETPNRG